MAFMIAVSIAPKIRPALRPVLWIVAVTLIVLTCIARVWAGAHWPSDVLGGVLLGVGWSAFVLWLPERWLPSPSFRWFRGRTKAMT
jgi:undecaprenyl-diphosphatase